MEVFKQTKTVKGVDGNIYIFKAHEGNHGRACEITIEDGKIQKIVEWDNFSEYWNAYSIWRNFPNFTKICCSIIEFIGQHNIEELSNIYSVLRDTTMKDFCKQIQNRKLAELDF